MKSICEQQHARASALEFCSPRDVSMLALHESMELLQEQMLPGTTKHLVSNVPSQATNAVLAGMQASQAQRSLTRRTKPSPGGPLSVPSTLSWASLKSAGPLPCCMLQLRLTLMVSFQGFYEIGMSSYMRASKEWVIRDMVVLAHMLLVGDVFRTSGTCVAVLL